MITDKNYSAQDFEDMGVYLRGLLQIMAVDNNLHKNQQEKIKIFAKKMGFEEKYIERNIETVLNNKFIPKTPPKFHSRTTAKAFLIEAAGIAVCDGVLHPNEKEWLIEAAEKNDLDMNLIMNVLDTVPLSDNNPE